MGQTISKTFKIVNERGLHARASALFVKTADLFESDIFVSRGKNKVNGKSVMGLLTLAASIGTRIKVEANGPDAKLAVEKLGDLVSRGFYEQS